MISVKGSFLTYLEEEISEMQIWLVLSIVARLSETAYSAWMPVAENVEFGAKEGKNGEFIVPFTGYIKGVRIVHIRGGFSCSSSYWPTLTNFGCDGRSPYSNDNLAVWITTQNKTELFPQPEFTEILDGGFYNIPEFTAFSPVIELFQVTNSVYLAAGDTLKIFYSEDLVSRSTSDNAGTAFVNIFGCMCLDEIACQRGADCRCLPGYILGDDNICVEEIWTDCSITCGNEIGTQTNQIKQTRHCSTNITCPVWMPLAKNVCFGSANESFGNFTVNYPGYMWAVRLVHVSGGVTCNTKLPKTNFGCGSKVTLDKISTFITAAINSSVIYWPDARYLQKSIHRFYDLPRYGPNSSEIVLFRHDEPIATLEPIEMHMLYGQDLFDYSEGNNEGVSCVQVYGCLCMKESKCEKFDCYPGFFVGDNNICVPDVWTDCSVTCGEGIQINQIQQTRNCSTNVTCPDEVMMGEWSSWGECSEPCDWGTRSRSRESVNVDNAASYKHSKPCKVKECAVSGFWSDWGSWSVCSKTCGNGVRSRSRQCDHPPPAYGGLNCPGINNQTQYCGLTAICPVNGGWSSWSESTKCNKPCGNGTTKRLRDCTNPAPQFGGKSCEGEIESLTSCNTHECKEVKLNVAVEFTDEEFMLQYENINSEPSKALSDKIEDRIKKLYAKHNIQSNFRVEIHEMKFRQMIPGESAPKNKRLHLRDGDD